MFIERVEGKDILATPFSNFTKLKSQEESSMRISYYPPKNCLLFEILY